MANDHPAGCAGHDRPHAFSGLKAREAEGLAFVHRRGMLKAGLAGLAGLSLPRLLQARDVAGAAGRPIGSRKSVILLWMAGGPSQIDTWDPKPDRPEGNRGPFAAIQTKIPGVQICEHLPKQAAMLDKFTILRGVDCRHSNHEPNKVMQTANLLAEPRTNPSAEMYPAIGSIIAKMRGANHPAMPPYVAFQTSRSHIAYGGYLGKAYDPFLGRDGASLPVYTDVGVDTGRKSGGGFFQLPRGITPDRLHARRSLLESVDQVRADLDRVRSVEAMGGYGQKAIDLLVGTKARDAFDMSKEDPKVRERYGKHLWCQQALLARRLVEAGVAFVTLDLSYHGASGTWDNHGDNIPPYGGIKNGLQPLLPLFDHLITTLVGDLDDRGLLDETLVIAMGEFGRTPRIGTQGSTDGRDHWPNVMSMCLAGGGLRHGQVIGSSDRDGGYIASRPVTPGDLAATIYRHMGVPVDAVYLDPTDRPHAIVERGEPIAELF
ncbi:DUF1501 domain-containing protein [Tundrisphaera sp. TA3]|uniref:DUF1501 domain-containing protein n=1 Tax=Tundrisphaera sp. TA3 TaxID=3435775 RepID=UPI003EBBE96F